MQLHVMAVNSLLTLLTLSILLQYNVVINAYAKSGGKGAAQEAEQLLQRMHMMYDQGDLSVKPNVVTYGAVIDAFAKSMDRNAAARADALLANMVALHQSDPVRHADLRPNTYVFNTVINVSCFMFVLSSIATVSACSCLTHSPFLLLLGMGKEQGARCCCQGRGDARGNG